MTVGKANSTDKNMTSETLEKQNDTWKAKSEVPLHLTFNMVHNIENYLKK